MPYLSSLYTNIPHQESILEVADYLRRDNTKRPISNFMSFDFNTEHHLEVVGKAMDTSLAPNSLYELI